MAPSFHASFDAERNTPSGFEWNPASIQTSHTAQALDVNADGTVVIESGTGASNGYDSLDGITFFAEN